MKVSILGGGNEVGATCLHIEIAGTNLLIDAGMRMHADDPMPALGMLENLGDPDAVLVTHAHADHIGALPVIHSLYPKAPVYTTPPTADLMKIMMKDSYKILEQRCIQTNTLIPYTEDQVNSLLGSLLLFPASGVLRIGNVNVTIYRAGHILGAVMILLEGDGETILVTGDLSFNAGRTIPGAQVPHGINPDVVVMESTYGNRIHTDRNTEERNLANHISEVISDGGFALIPAFALGRAQEILLVLQDYMDKGLIPEFPIYVDGLVTPISRIYKNYPHFLKGPVAHRIKNNGDAFLTEGRCKAVSPKERDEILKGKPGCIVASSGMLIGGASSWYAQRLISDEKNAIFITGYQDEESPGRRLLNIAEGNGDFLELNGTSYPVKCRIGKYGLSAHADSNEIKRFIESLDPTYVLLVHGDDEARSQLASQIDPKHHPILVENGETYPFEKRDSGKGVKGKRYQSNQSNAKLQEKVGHLLLYRPESENTFKLAICTGFNLKASILFCQTLKGKQVKLNLSQVVETFGSWNRSMDELKQAADQVFTFSRPYLEVIDWSVLPEQTLSLQEVFQRLQVESLKEQLAVGLVLQGLPNEYRITDERGFGLYTFNIKVKQLVKDLNLPIQGLKVNPNLAMDAVRVYMGDHARFIRCGVDSLGTSQERITIYFDFPDAVSELERIEAAVAIRKTTGWEIDFSDSVRQDLLQGKLSKMLGKSLGSLSIHLNERTVVIPVSRPTTDAQTIIDQFKKDTGFDLHFKEDKRLSIQTSTNKHAYQANTPSKRMENNKAIEEAKMWALDRGITIYKTGIRDQNGEIFMEVHFISPEVAMHHEPDLEELSYRIGMPVTFAQQPKQNEIIRITTEFIPESWKMVKNPSIHIGKSLVTVKVTSIPSEAEKLKVSTEIEKMTGYSLEIVG
ncbi:MBL fold metallo-hydrolase [Bacillus sp. DJP31]|uniref:MBL fold metallo-hydrolase n=1 Tax=Bacillus sp. DJP31 TaxID=3409789 RepID=UPI003BB48B2F